MTFKVVKIGNCYREVGGVCVKLSLRFQLFRSFSQHVQWHLIEI